MVAFISRRLIEAIPVVFVSTILIFSLLRLLPGDPAQVLAGPDASPQVVEAIRHEFGLDRSLPEQYVVWLSHVIRGDLGNSVLSHLPVGELIGRRVPATLELTIGAMALTLLIAFPVGILTAVRRGRYVDVAFSVYQGVMLSVPNFWLGILAILLFALVLGWLPPGGFIPLQTNMALGLKALILPAATLALPSAAGLSRLVRASMLEVLGEDYVRTARAKGLGGQAVVVRHAMRNALVPVVTVLGLQFGRLIGGSVIIESVFTWPGVGRLIVDSIGTRDYAVVQGAMLLFVMVFVITNLATDISYGFIDPRIRLSASRR